MPPRPDQAIDLQTIAKEVARLCRHIGELEASVAKLTARFRLPPTKYAEDDRPEGTDDRPWLEYFGQEQAATVRNILFVAQQADAHLDMLQRDFGKILAKLNQIENDSWSRAELKGHLKDK